VGGELGFEGGGGGRGFGHVAALEDVEALHLGEGRREKRRGGVSGRQGMDREEEGEGRRLLRQSNGCVVCTSVSQGVGGTSSWAGRTSSSSGWVMLRVCLGRVCRAILCCWCTRARTEAATSAGLVEELAASPPSRSVLSTSTASPRS
jgi:hypothetical protein